MTTRGSDNSLNRCSSATPLIVAGSDILHRLLPLFDRREEFRESLRNRGFNAIAPRLLHIESYGSTEDELQIHRKISIEKAKERFFLEAVWVPEFGKVYRSDYLRNLEEQRDRQNDMSVEQLRASVSLDVLTRLAKEEIDPCIRSKIIEEKNNRDAHNKKHAYALAARNDAIDREASRYRSFQEGKVELTNMDYLKLLNTIMYPFFDSTGFCMKASKVNSKRAALHQVARKLVGKDYVFQLHVFADYDFIEPLRADLKRLAWPTLDIALTLDDIRGKNKVWRMDRGTRLPILFHELIPELEHTYRFYSDRAYFQLSLEARLTLISQVFPEIEATAQEVLLA